MSGCAESTSSSSSDSSDSSSGESSGHSSKQVTSLLQQGGGVRCDGDFDSSS